MTDLEKHKLLMRNFTAPEGYNLFDYYGITFMKVKKTSEYSLMLQYDYKKHAINSPKALVIKDFDKAIIAVKLLEKYSVDNKVVMPDVSFL